MRPAKKSRRWGWKRITLPVVLLISELPEASRYLEVGHARGKIIVDVAATEP